MHNGSIENQLVRDWCVGFRPPIPPEAARGRWQTPAVASVVERAVAERRTYQRASHAGGDHEVGEPAVAGEPNGNLRIVVVAFGVVVFGVVVFGLVVAAKMVVRGWWRMCVVLGV